MGQEQTAAENFPGLLIDPYEDWARAQGVPIVEGYGVDLLAIETSPWDLFDANGAIVHLKGRGDFVTMFLLDMPRGGAISPQQHLYEQFVYVISGHGSTTIETSDGRSHSFEWGAKSLFCLPLNVKYRIFNGSGREPARLAFCNYFPLVKKLFHKDEFIFRHSFGFPEREGQNRYFTGEGDFMPVKPGMHLWETNFVPDVSSFELKIWEKRGAGSSNIQFILGDGVMKAHCSAMPVGTYKKAHRHGPDFSIFPVIGSGYSLFWYEGDQDLVRVDWHHGMVFAPPEMMFHQHFNTSAEPARYLAVALGSLKYPFLSARRKQIIGVDVDVRSGGQQLEYEDQNPRIHELFLKELAKNGVESRMGKYFDESMYRAVAAS